MFPKNTNPVDDITISNMACCVGRCHSNRDIAAISVMTITGFLSDQLFPGLFSATPRGPFYLRGLAEPALHMGVNK